MPRKHKQPQLQNGKKINQALPEKYAKYSVLTVLGVSGRVANFKQVHTEGSPGIVDVLVTTFTPEQRLTVKHVCTDFPTQEQYDRLKEVLPNLKCLSLDPMHICYKFKRSQGKQQDGAGYDLKRLMCKFAVRPVDGHAVGNYGGGKTQPADTDRL